MRTSKVISTILVGAVGAWLFSAVPSGLFRCGRAVAQVVTSQPSAPGADSVRGAVMGRVDAVVSESDVISHPTRRGVERTFASLPLPAVLESVFVDVAELVLTVSTAYDSTEPLFIAAFPATAPVTARPTTWSAEWDEMSGGFDPELMTTASVCDTREAVEIRLNITEFVRRWQAGDAPNYGIVLKSLSENKSTFHWIQDGRYDGGNARLEIRYTRL